MFAGLIYCVSGHQPLAMQGKTRKGHVYHACGYSNSYGDTAATEIHAGQKWVSLREDTLLPLVEQFFKEHIWGPCAWRSSHPCRRVDLDVGFWLGR